MGVLSAMDLTDGYWIRQHTRSTTAISNLKVCASFTGLEQSLAPSRTRARNTRLHDRLRLHGDKL